MHTNIFDWRCSGPDDDAACIMTTMFDGDDAHHRGSSHRCEPTIKAHLLLFPTIFPKFPTS